MLFTNKRDITTDFIVRELRRRGRPFLRINTEDLPRFGVVLPQGDAEQAVLQLGGGSWPLSAFGGAYFRRPKSPAREPGEAPEIAAYVEAEWSSLLRALWNALEGRWLNSPFAIQRAEDKPRQLAAARACGLQVPETLVTNSVTALEGLSARGWIGKPLRRALLDDAEGPGSLIYTTRLDDLRAIDAEALFRAPIILQREIAKRCDVRVTVVDDRTFPARIFSQGHSETEVDWRRGARVDLEHSRMEIPPVIELGCIEVTRKLGLRYAAIDLVEDLNGEIWFLEANPNGQWAWIEQRTGLPIAAAIVDALGR